MKRSADCKGDGRKLCGGCSPACSNRREVPAEYGFPEGHDGLITTIQYALPKCDGQTYYKIAVFIAERIQEWLKDPSKIPGTVLRREVPVEPERPPIICNGCHPKPCSGCRWENERCNHRPSTKGDHLCRYFSEPAEPELVICPDMKFNCLRAECFHATAHKKHGIYNTQGALCQRTAMGCVPYKPEEKVVCPVTCMVATCSHRAPHKKESDCDVVCKQGSVDSPCIPLVPSHPTTGASTGDKPDTKTRSGTPIGGSSKEPFSCPLNHSVRGALTLRPSSRIHPEARTTENHPILIFQPRNAILCVCGVTVPNTKGKLCVLDVENKVIISLPIHPRERFVGAANPKPNASISSTERNSDVEYAAAMIKKYGGITTPEKSSGTGSGSRSEKKRIVPIVAKPGGKESGTHNAMRTP